MLNWDDAAPAYVDKVDPVDAHVCCLTRQQCAKSQVFGTHNNQENRGVLHPICETGCSAGYRRLRGCNP